MAEAIETLPTASLPDGYEFVISAPTVPEYMNLRASSGLSPVSEEQAKISVNGGWYAVHVRHAESGSAVAMGRLIGDGGWYFHVCDMAVLPQHQRLGLGKAILSNLLHYIKENAPKDAYVNLMADPPGVGLYRKFGFKDGAPEETGMWRKLD